MRSVIAVVSCPVCGEAEWTESTQRVNELRGVLSAECVKGHPFGIVVEVLKVRATEGCGTSAGYKRHQRAGETPCFACREAHNQVRVGQKRRQRVTLTAEPTG